MVGLIALAAALNGCSTQQTLPVAQFPDRCRGVGIDGVLAGSVSDPRVTWLETEQGGQLPLVWPPGWRARFSPDLQVLDDQGVVRMKAGDRVSSICEKGPAGDPSRVVMIEGLTTGGD
jgi:hypothetical protein